MPVLLCATMFVANKGREVQPSFLNQFLMHFLHRRTERLCNMAFTHIHTPLHTPTRASIVINRPAYVLTATCCRNLHIYFTIICDWSDCEQLQYLKGVLYISLLLSVTDHATTILLFMALFNSKYSYILNCSKFFHILTTNFNVIY